MSGAHEPDDGTIEIDGQRRCVFGSPQGALGRGVATIYQDLALAPRQPDLAEHLHRRGADARARCPACASSTSARCATRRRRYLARLKVDDPTTPIAPSNTLSGGQRQAVAIARALHWNARLVIMDEPTAALGVAESRQVLDLIRELHRGGTTVILISHNMAEVVDVATRVAVFKSGRKIADRPPRDSPRDDLAHLVMTGTAAMTDFTAELEARRRRRDGVRPRSRDARPHSARPRGAHAAHDADHGEVRRPGREESIRLVDRRVARRVAARPHELPVRRA